MIKITDGRVSDPPAPAFVTLWSRCAPSGRAGGRGALAARRAGSAARTSIVFISSPAGSSRSRPSALASHLRTRDDYIYGNRVCMYSVERSGTCHLPVRSVAPSPVVNTYMYAHDINIDDMTFICNSQSAAGWLTLFACLPRARAYACEHWPVLTYMMITRRDLHSTAANSNYLAPAAAACAVLKLKRALHVI